MKRKIIHINEDLCNGCGACAFACHEGAIAMVNGKAKLAREDYCDGLGDCLPACPTGAISFEEREAPAYNEKAVKENKARKGVSSPSRLVQWPCQIKLVPLRAPYFDGADLLIAADCAAYAYGAFHEDFMKNRITLIGCPKLDAVDYAEKLTAILHNNTIRSVTVVRMEVPCCSGIENAVTRALKASGKIIPHVVVTLTTDGKILKNF
ncbi:MAG: 4Fe-4S binding protein [Clostridia bacterium]|nr:4Fe-4S binding protein [Clostridia bacterium]